VRPVLYDFKRGVLRSSVIVTLILFILAGIGIAYAISALMAMMPTPQNNILYSYIDASTGEFKLEVQLLDPDLRVVDGEVAYKLGCYNTTMLIELHEQVSRGNITYREYLEKLEELLRIVDDGVERSSAGRVVVTKTLREPLSAEIACKLYLNITTVYGSFSMSVSWDSGYSYNLHKIDDTSIYVLTLTPGLRGYGIITEATNSTLYLTQVFEVIIEAQNPRLTSNTVTPLSVGKEVLGEVSATLYAFTTGKSILLVSLYSYVDTEFDLYIEKINVSSVPTTISVDEISEYFTHIGKVRRGISVLELDLNLLGSNERPLKNNLRVLLVSRSDNTTLYADIVSVVQLYQSGLAMRLVASQIAGSSGTGLFAVFFPVVVLYLVYVYIAKPRAQGALEFVLARPITRLEVYATRYFAGVFVILTVTALFYIALLLGIYYFTGVLIEVYPSLILYSGLVLSSIAFYSLCYMFSTIVSGTRYIVVSIILYIVLSFLWGLIISLIVIALKGFTAGIGEEITRLTYISYYFNPLGADGFMRYYYMVHITGSTNPIIEGVVNQWLVALSITAWITIPALIGWLIFKRTNLSG